MEVTELESALLAKVTEGQRYGLLTVKKRSGSSGDGRKTWECACDCGKTRIVTTKSLRSGSIAACADCSFQSSRSPLHVRLQKWLLSPNGCHEWTGKRNELGYGRITVDGRETMAHRAMFFMLNPEADRSLVVMHRCDNPCCINPNHLEIGTVRENMLDMHEKGRFRGGAQSPGTRMLLAIKDGLRAASSSFWVGCPADLERK